MTYSEREAGRARRRARRARKAKASRRTGRRTRRAAAAALAVLCLAPAASARPLSDIPGIDATPFRPDITRALAPFGEKHVRRCASLTDVHVYSGASGRPFRQVGLGGKQTAWIDRRDSVVMGFDRVNCDLYNLTRRTLIFAGWRS